MQVTNRACSFVNDLATTCRTALGHFAEQLVVSCLDSARSHAQVLYEVGEACMTARSNPNRYNVKALVTHFDPARGGTAIESIVGNSSNRMCRPSALAHRAPAGDDCPVVDKDRP